MLVLHEQFPAWNGFVANLHEHCFGAKTCSIYPIEAWFSFSYQVAVGYNSVATAGIIFTSSSSWFFASVTDLLKVSRFGLRTRHAFVCLCFTFVQRRRQT